MGEVDITVPKDVPVLIHRTCEYGTLHGKKDCVEVIKFRILTWEDHSGLPGWAK